MVDQVTETPEQQYFKYGNIIGRSNYPFQIGEVVRHEDWEAGDREFPGDPNPSYVKARTWRVVARSSQEEWRRRNPTRAVAATYDLYFLIAVD